MGVLTLDIECDNLDPLNPKLVGYAYKVDDGPIFWSTDIDQVHELLSDPLQLKVCHNVKFELSYLKGMGIEMVGPYYCTMVAAQLSGLGVPSLRNDGKTEYSYGLKALAEKHLSFQETPKFSTLAKQFMVDTPTGIFLKSGKEKIKRRPALASEIPEGVLSEYCMQDRGCMPVFEKVEMPLISVLSKMELTGIGLDVPYLKQLATKLESDIEAIDKQLEEWV